jgi:predicted ATPase
MQLGDLIAGRFRLEARAGAGAMGVVFRACDCAAGGSPVAIKAWRTEGVTASERFLREAAALAQLTSPAVVGHIQHGVSEAGEPYLAMEWIEGPTLAERLAGRGVTPSEALALTLRVLEGLCALHAVGIVHRDLKPSNLMLPNDEVGAARILDLGVARIVDASVDLTLANTQLGTPRYMAPEQIRDPRQVDGRADVFALGAVLFECLTGVPAFGGDDPVVVLAQILFAQTPVVSELRPELPAELDRLVSRMLARRPELRFDAGDELRGQLAGLLAPGRWGARLAGLGAARSAALGSAGSESARAALLSTRFAPATRADVSGERVSVVPLLGRARPLVPTALRGDLPPLIGRERELSELVSWLHDDRPVSLWGGPGVGKTRLALELAQLAVAHALVPEQGVVFCDLTSAHSSADVVRICAAQLGVASLGPDAEDRLGRLLGKLGSVLVVLDRAEHLIREIAPLIQLWTQHAPALRVLVTSRVRLRTTREYALGPLSNLGRAPSRRDAKRFGQAVLATSAPPLTAAAQLVLSFAKAAADGVDAAQARYEQAESLAAALEGNPLAIELAMARLPVLGFQGILERLPAQLSLLAEQSSATTMRKAIEWSWQLLGVAERSAFMQCSVFVQPFTLRAAEAVLVLAAEQGAVLDVVQSLREQSLLSSRADAERPGQMRLSMPAVVREFAREQLARAVSAAGGAERDLVGAAERHAEYFCRLAEAREVERSDAGVGVEELVAAIEYSLSPEGHEPTRALRLLLALEGSLLEAGYGSSLARLLEQSLAGSVAAASGDVGLSALRLRALLLRARLLAPAGELALARADLEYVLGQVADGDEDALRESHQSRQSHEAHQSLRARALLDLGVVHHFARDLTAARRYYNEALGVFYSLDEAVAEARCHGNLGAVDHDQARLALASEGYRRALALLPEYGQERLVANFESNLALVEHELGRLSAARQLYTSAARRLESLLDVRLLGIVLGNFGTLALAEEVVHEAVQHFMRAAALLEQSGDRRSEGLSLARLAVGLAWGGRQSEAEHHAARAERLLRKDAAGRAVAALLSAFVDLQAAEAACAQGQLSSARALSERAVTKSRDAEPLREESDDVRLYLALLQPRLVQLGERLDAALRAMA